MKISCLRHLEGKQPQLGHLPTMVVDHFLNWMILSLKFPNFSHVVCPTWPLTCFLYNEKPRWVDCITRTACCNLYPTSFCILAMRLSFFKVIYPVILEEPKNPRILKSQGSILVYFLPWESSDHQTTIWENMFGNFFQASHKQIQVGSERFFILWRERWCEFLGQKCHGIAQNSPAGWSPRNGGLVN